MAHPLEALLKLQNKDRKIFKLQREIRDIPARKADIESQLEKAAARLTKAREGQMQAQSDVKQLEIEIGAHREKADRYRSQQDQAKNNEQYRALLHEIAAEDGAVKELEESEMGLLEKVEAFKKTIADREAELAEEEEAIAEEKEMLFERFNEIKEDMAALLEERKVSTAAIDKTLMTRYERLLKNKRDFAVVRVENGHCKGCNMQMPPQIVNDALNPAKLVSCNYCGRMLINSIERI